MRGRMAERVGFEPTVEFPLHTLSKRAPSTTRTSLHFRINNLRAVEIRLSHTPMLFPTSDAITFVFNELNRSEKGNRQKLCKTS